MPASMRHCSNPVRLDAMGAEIDAATWARVFKEAEALGVMQVTLTGGEPLLRPDLEQLVRAARDSDLFTTLITSGIPTARDTLARLRDAGLEGVQLSFQDVDGGASARIAGVDALARKRQVASFIRELGLPLTVNIVLHRENLPRLPEMIAMAERSRADRLELAHVQYLGWALANRSILLPTAAMIAEARATVSEARGAFGGPDGDRCRVARLLFRSAARLHGWMGAQVHGRRAGWTCAALPCGAHAAWIDLRQCEDASARRYLEGIAGLHSLSRRGLAAAALSRLRPARRRLRRLSLPSVPSDRRHDADRS